VFPSVAAAFDAHAELIATAPVYSQAMAALPDVNAFIDRMAAHYATDPTYSNKLKSMIATNNLSQYDEVKP
jgi:flagellum-specific peptidoglycan hydrolase FlgJ